MTSLPRLERPHSGEPDLHAPPAALAQELRSPSRPSWHHGLGHRAGNGTTPPQGADYEDGKAAAVSGFTLQACSQIALSSAGEHLVVVKNPKSIQVFMTRFFPACVSGEIELAAKYVGKPPGRFSFRGLAPVTQGNLISLFHAEEKSGGKVWCEAENGVRNFVAQYSDN